MSRRLAEAGDHPALIDGRDVGRVEVDGNAGEGPEVHLGQGRVPGVGQQQLLGSRPGRAGGLDRAAAGRGGQHERESNTRRHGPEHQFRRAWPAGTRSWCERGAVVAMRSNRLQKGKGKTGRRNVAGQGHRPAGSACGISPAPRAKFAEPDRDWPAPARRSVRKRLRAAACRRRAAGAGAPGIAALAPLQRTIELLELLDRIGRNGGWRWQLDARGRGHGLALPPVRTTLSSAVRPPPAP